MPILVFYLSNKSYSLVYYLNIKKQKKKDNKKIFGFVRGNAAMARLLYCSHLVMSIDHGQSSRHSKYYSGDELLEKISFNIWFLGQMNINHLDF